MTNLSIIREICKEKNITLTKLSEKINITYAGMQRILLTNSTKIETLEKIAKELDVPIIVFFGEINDEQKIIIQKLKDEIENKDKEILELLKEAREGNKKIIGLIEKVGIYEKRGPIDYSLDLGNIDALIKDYKKSKNKKNVKALEDYIKELKNRQREYENYIKIAENALLKK